MKFLMQTKILITFNNNEHLLVFFCKTNPNHVFSELPENCIKHRKNYVLCRKNYIRHNSNYIRPFFSACKRLINKKLYHTVQTQAIFCKSKGYVKIAKFGFLGHLFSFPVFSFSP